MKTLSSSLLAISSLFLAATLPAAPEAPAQGHRVSVIEQFGLPTVELGTSEFTVRRLLGEPYRKLNRETWVYVNFRALPEQAPNDNCRTLVITFNGGRVADLKLVNDQGEKVIVAQLNAKEPAPRAVFAANESTSSTK